MPLFVAGSDDTIEGLAYGRDGRFMLTWLPQMGQVLVDTVERVLFQAVNYDELTDT